MQSTKWQSNSIDRPLSESTPSVRNGFGQKVLLLSYRQGKASRKARQDKARQGKLQSKASRKKKNARAPKLNARGGGELEGRNKQVAQGGIFTFWWRWFPVCLLSTLVRGWKHMHPLLGVTLRPHSHTHYAGVPDGHTPLPERTLRETLSTNKKD